MRFPGWIATIALACVAAMPAWAQDDARMRVYLSSPLLMGSRDAGPVEPLVAETEEPVAFATVGDAFSLPVTVTGNVGQVRITFTEGTSLPGVNPSPSGLSGYLTHEGSHTFSIVVTDDVSDPVTLGPWTVEVDRPLVTGSLAPSLAVTTGTATSFPLPAVDGGLAPWQFSVSPEDPQLVIEGGSLRITALQDGPLGDFRIEVRDSRDPARVAYSEHFSVLAGPEAPVASDLYIEGISSNGTLARGATALLAATGVHNTQSVRLDKGEFVQLDYDRNVRSTAVRLQLYTIHETCSNANGHLKFVAANPKVLLRTSLDGLTWHDHPTDMYLPSTTSCGYSPYVRLDSGHAVYKHIRVEIVDSRQAIAGLPDVATDVVYLRPANINY